MHVLVVESNTFAQRVVAKQLSEAFDLTVVGDLAAADINLRRSAFDAVLLSVDDDFETVLQWVLARRRPAEPLEYRPVVLLTSRYTEDLAYRAWRHGVHVTRAKPLLGVALRELLTAQIADPQAEPVTRTSCTLELVTWVVGDTHHCYSPDLDRSVSGSSETAVRARMEELLDVERDRLRSAPYGEARVRIRRQRLELGDG